MRRPPAVQRYRDVFVLQDLVHELEALIDRANPPLSTLTVDGWQVRTARGFTQTANSVWPRATRGRLPLDARVREVERVYTARGLPPRFQISPSASPRDLDRALAAAGYASTPPVEVRTAQVEHLAGRGRAGAVTVSAQAAPWLAAWARITEQPDAVARTAADLLERVRAAQAFALLDDPAGVAVARGVLYGGWLGVDYLAATPGLRSPATGQALLGALARWAGSRDGEQAYRAVGPAHAGAVPVPAAGWRRAYTYRFRVHPLAPPAPPHAGP